MTRRLLAAIAAVAFTTGAAQAADLKICVEGAYPPFSQVDPSGEIVGFDIDITNALCEEMGKSCELLQTDWDGIIPALLEGKCDAIIASMSITEDRRKVIDFSGKYQNTPAKFAAKEGVDWEDTNDGLSGIIVGVQRGTIHHDYMESVYPDVELKLYGTQDEAYLDLTAGRIDAILADSLAIEEGFLKTEAGEGYAFFGRDHTDPTYFGEGAGVGVRKEDTELRDAFSAAIMSIREKGIFKEINDRYFEFDIYGDPGA